VAVSKDRQKPWLRGHSWSLDLDMTPFDISHLSLVSRPDKLRRV